MTVNEPYSRIYAKINLDHIIKNMEALTANLPRETKVIGIVKADGYGHGAVPIAKAIDPFVWGYGVAAIEEAVILRNHGIMKPILVLGNVSTRFFNTYLDYDITPTLFEWSKAEALSQLAVRRGQKASVHIAVDTGMSRIGYRPGEESLSEIEAISRLPGITITGLYTHFSKADETGRETTEKQYECFCSFEKELSRRGILIPVKHCANSAAILDYGEMSLDAIRAGIAIYGLYPSGQVGQEQVKLHPAMEICSFITYIKDIEAGTQVSYGGTFVAEKSMRIATISAGYGDGYPRNLSAKGSVLIAGKRAPILGRVCMDQFMVDVSGIPEAKPEDLVILLGRCGEECITMEELAETGGGFHYEIPCTLGKRVPRVYISGGRVIGRKDYNNDRYEDFLK